MPTPQPNPTQPIKKGPTATSYMVKIIKSIAFFWPPLNVAQEGCITRAITLNELGIPAAFLPSSCFTPQFSHATWLPLMFEIHPLRLSSEPPHTQTLPFFLFSANKQEPFLWWILLSPFRPFWTLTSRRAAISVANFMFHAQAHPGQKGQELVPGQVGGASTDAHRRASVEKA